MQVRIHVLGFPSIVGLDTLWPSFDRGEGDFDLDAWVTYRFDGASGRRTLRLTLTFRPVYAATR